MGASDGQSPEWFRLHGPFHTVLDAASGRRRRRLVAMIETLRRESERYIQVFQVVSPHAARLAAQHERILEATRRRSATAVAERVKDHLAFIRGSLTLYVGQALSRAEAPLPTGTAG